MSDQYNALEAAYSANRAALLRFLVARTGDLHEATDLLQEVWVRLHLARIRDISNGRAYLYRVANNLVIDRMRERQRRQRREEVWSETQLGYSSGDSPQIDPAANPEEALLAREEIALLTSALATIPPGARRAFQLCKFEGHSHAEVAAAMGISSSGVEKHIAVAMKYIRRALLD